MRPIMAGAALGSSAVWPERVWPFWTTSRLVPSAEISLSRPAEADDDRPRTATMAATPMAMPSADSPARSLRVRNPTVARRARSDGRSLLASACCRDGHGRGSAVDGVTGSGPPGRRGLVGAVEDDLAVEHLDAPAHARGDLPVVGDDHDGHPAVVQLFEEPQDGPSGRLVEVAGGLVGEARWPGRPTRARAMATRCRWPPESWVGRAWGRSPRPTSPRASRARSAARPRDPGVEEAVGHVVERRSGARPRRTVGTRNRSGSPAAQPAPGRRAGRCRGR